MATSIDKAIDIIIEKVNSIQKYEIVPIELSLNRVSKEDIFAIYPLPRFNNSAMDGYGVRLDSKDILFIVDTVFAGDDKANININNSQAIKIMTGARVPKDIELIIPKENILEELDNNRIKIDINFLKKNQHIRFIGEDVNINDNILSKGEKIDSSHIALLASQGISHIKVLKQVKISIFATGEELKLHYEKIQPHQIYNSNTPTLLARCKELDCEVDFIGVTKDSLDDIKRTINNSLDSDLIITSGGVSVGDADFTKEAFNSFKFEKYFEKLDIKPGKPTVFGKIDKTYILNLPGNPLAAISIFEIFGRTIINKLSGLKDNYLSYIPLPLTKELKQKNGKYSLVPGKIDNLGFTPAEKRAPGMVSVLRDCNAFILTNNNISNLNKNSIVKVLPIYFTLLSNKKVDIYTQNI